jgi:hypothetical protein
MDNHPKHPFLEALVLGGLVFYFAIAVVLLFGLVSWMVGGDTIILNASWIRWCAAIAMVPLLLRLGLRPEAQVFCRRCKTWLAGCLTRRRKPLSYDEMLTRKEQRHYPRYHVELPARVSTDKGTRGFAMVADLSVKGCRVKSKTHVSPGDYGKLLISVPSGVTPLTVSVTSVRWVKGYECGLEFIFIDLDEQSGFDRCLNGAKRQVEPALATVS